MTAAPPRGELTAYFLLTFAFTWTVWLSTALLGGPGSMVFFPGGPVFLVGVFGPGLVAVALTARREGRAGVTRLLAPIGRWQAAWPLYVFALSYMAATKLAAALLHRWLFAEWPAFGDLPLLLVPAAIAVSTWVQAGEEVGWRGYALPRLAVRLGRPAAAVVLGVVWALWHLPLFYLAGSGSDGQPFLVYLLHVTAMSIAMAWLYWRSHGSLLLVMVMHAAVNNTTGIVPIASPVPGDPLSVSAQPIAWLTVAVAWLIAVGLLPRLRRTAADPVVESWRPPGDGAQA